MSDTTGLRAAFARANYAIYLAKLAQEAADNAGGGTTYTFASGVTESPAGTVKNDLITGKVGGQTIVGGTVNSEGLTLSSTLGATKGKIFLGSSGAYHFDEQAGLLTLNGSTFNNAGVLKLGSASVFVSPQNSATFGSQPSMVLWDTTLGSGAAPGQIFSLGINNVSVWGTGTQFDIQSRFTGANLDMKNAFVIRFYDNNINSGSPDTGLTRSAAGKLEVNNGTAGTFRDISLRKVYMDSTITAGGTNGAQTINKASGTVNIAAGGTSVVVTNNLVTTSSIVYAVLRTADSTATIKNVVPAAGSFTITLGASATAAVSVGFVVFN